MTVRKSVYAAIGAVPVAIAILSSSAASAAPAQPGTTQDPGPGQSGAATAPQAGAGTAAQPGATTANPAPQESTYVPPRWTPRKPKPVEPPMIRIGTIFTSPVPEWMPRDVADNINRTAADAEKQINQTFGTPPPAKR